MHFVAYLENHAFDVISILVAIACVAWADEIRRIKIRGMHSWVAIHKAILEDSLETDIRLQKNLRALISSFAARMSLMFGWFVIACCTAFVPNQLLHKTVPLFLGFTLGQIGSNLSYCRRIWFFDRYQSKMRAKIQKLQDKLNARQAAKRLPAPRA